MMFIILFEDEPQADPAIRRTHMARHLNFLEQNAATIEIAGPLSDSSGTGRGGLWIVKARSEAAVTELVHADPFWPTGLRKSFTILRWHQVFADGARLIDPC